VCALELELATEREDCQLLQQLATPFTCAVVVAGRADCRRKEEERESCREPSSIRMH